MCFAFTLFAIFLAFRSPDIILWTGQTATGTERSGLVYYRWDGQAYTLDAPGYGSAKAVTVYLNPGNPNDAMLNNVPDRVEAGLLVVPTGVAGVVLILMGGTRNYRWARKETKRAQADPREEARGQW